MDTRLEMNFRCCMCPQSGQDIKSCPAGEPCRFVKVYEDYRGWRYNVMKGIGENEFKAKYKKPGYHSWIGVRALPWKETFDRAQADLNDYAGQRNMQAIVLEQEG